MGREEGRKRFKELPPRFIEFYLFTYLFYFQNSSVSVDGRCNLCLEEKIHIFTHKLPDKLLNKRSELIARCRYRTKFKLLTINLKT